MFKHVSWLAAGVLMIAGAFGLSARAEEDGGAEAALDLSLRTKAAAMPVIAADGSTVDSPASHILLEDFDTGSVLLSRAANEKMYPSSMTKILTLYIVFDRLKQGALSLSSQFTVSEKAWRMQGSKMFVPLGGQIGLEDLIRGIAIQSGNDACVVVAEGVAGSEAAFAKQMNDTAKQLGMTGSNFVNSDGWPDAAHLTTPHDLMTVAVALIRNFPEYYHYFSEREFSYHNIRQFNRNLLLGNPSLKVDGLKTGHTEAAGYGIVLSAKDPVDGRRLVLVVNGLDSEAARAQEGERLLKWGFANFTNQRAFAANQPIAQAPVWMGAARELPLTVGGDVSVTVPKTGASKLSASITYNAPLIAPVKQGQEVGKLTLTYADGTTRDYPLVAGGSTEKLGFLGEIPRAFGL